MARTMFPLRPPEIAPPRVGLLATFRPDQVTEREVGFTFDPEGCGESGVGDPDACNTDHDKDIPDNPDLVEVEPIYAWAGDSCSTFDWQQREYQARARRQLAATLSYQAARELWTGDQAQVQGSTTNRWLASEDSDVLTAGPTSPTDAVARLEQGIGECMKGAGVGVIHVTPHAATFLYQLGVILRQGNVLQTIMGTLVVADAGYDGSGPSSPAADGSVWAYGTGGVIVRMSPERLVPDPELTSGQAINRATNDVEYRAERLLAVGWDGCCHLAVEMNLGWFDEDGPGS